MSSLSVLNVLAVVGVIAVLPRLLYIFQVARRRKVEIRHRFKLAVRGVVLYGLSCAVLLHFGYTVLETLAFSILLGLTPAVFMKAPKRQRRIEAWVKREVILRDLKGQPFDPRIHHLHHVWPFVLGGDNSVKNLKVVTKDYNLSQGARKPGLLDLLGYRPKLPLESGSPSEETVSRQEPERTPRRLRFVVRIMLVAAILGFCWHLAKNQKPRANNEAPLLAGTTPAAPVAPTAGVTAIGATGQPEVSSATPTPLALPPSPADAGKEVAGGEAPQGTLPPPPQDSAPQPGAALPPGTSPSGKLVAPPEPAARTYTTSELFAMYKADKHGTDRALKGSSTQVVGTLRKAGKDELSLREPGDPDSVKCKFDSRENPARGRTSVGMTVTVKGKLKDRGVTGDIHLIHCELVGTQQIAQP